MQVTASMVFGIPAALMVLRLFVPIKGRWFMALVFLLAVGVFWWLSATSALQDDQLSRERGLGDDVAGNVAFAFFGGVFGAMYVGVLLWATWLLRQVIDAMVGKPVR